MKIFQQILLANIIFLLARKPTKYVPDKNANYTNTISKNKDRNFCSKATIAPIFIIKPLKVDTYSMFPAIQ